VRPYLSVEAQRKAADGSFPSALGDTPLHFPFLPKEELLAGPFMSSKGTKESLLSLCSMLPGRTVEDCANYYQEIRDGKRE